MNLFKRVLLGLVGCLVLLISVGFLLPSHVLIQRSLVIDATPQQIQPWIDDMRRWEEWMPWGKDVDPTVVHTFANSKTMEWQGEKMGEGSIVLTQVDPKTGVLYTASFNHGEMNSSGSLTYEPVPERTRVIWSDSMRLGNNPVRRYLGLLIDSMLGRDFEKGLAKLKWVVENR
ncbi:MAG: SRPBCC family protein [Myxococcaceae bacterium]